MSKKGKKNAADAFEQMMKQASLRFTAGIAIDQAVETARAAAAPIVEQGINKAKTKLTDIAVSAMTKLPVEELLKAAQSGQDLAQNAPKMAADLQAEVEKLASTLQSDVERMLANAQPSIEKIAGNDKLTAFFNDVKSVVEAMRPEAADEAAPEAETETPAAPAAEEAPAAPKKPRKPRKPRSPKP